VLGVGCVGLPSPDRDGDNATDSDRVREYNQRMVEAELNLVGGLVERVDMYQKPLILTASTGRGESKAITKLEQNGIYGYPTPETGARVLSHLARYSEYLRAST